jgi:tRNA nucleotidyltransferase (CCA-adding enzyme)
MEPKEKFLFLNKLLMENISLGFLYLERTEYFLTFEELSSLQNCKQNLIHHPEGSVWEHTRLVLTEASKYVRELPHEWQLPFMWGMLLHDFGKPLALDPETLQTINHDRLGESPARTVLSRFTDDEDFIEKVISIVICHMRPRLLLKGNPKISKWVNLHKICPLNILAYVSLVDEDGRSLPKTGKNNRTFIYLMNIHEYVQDLVDPVSPVLTGKYLISKGIKPGILMGSMLKTAYQYQLNNNCIDPEILYNISIQIKK